jgi:hypothetical protein
VISRNFLIGRSVTPINGMDGAMGGPRRSDELGVGGLIESIKNR